MTAGLRSAAAAVGDNPIAARQVVEHVWRVLTMTISRLQLAFRSAPLGVVLIGAVVVGGCGGQAATPSALAAAPTATVAAIATVAATPTLAPSPTNTATPAPSPSPSGPRSMPRGALDADTYVTYPSRGSAVKWQVTVPEGWTNGHDFYLYPTSLGGPEGPDGVAVALQNNPAVFRDDCDFGGGMTETRTVAELVAAIRAKDGWDVSKPEDVTIGGFSGQRLDVELHADLSVCGECCPMVFGEPGTENGFFQQGPAQQLRVWILDVDGQVVGLVREAFEASPADKVAEAQAVIESSVITP
jgi:hypothetical protein